ncbi:MULTISPECIES: AzlD domain-containing protein [unclassified Isoptericola]|uniref:AzlD domain-containing protein n=1 Tax=unclassified Isoptericola TaxID=2623355 RepID=UPI00271385E7|nr:MULTISPECIES: AzlD domain-containing protein [unclassified Isoptericola]MDO8144610.1 AzlD domain-containing protein [Isoptericola sp. 178]MDO8148455.1 AzlD domain-containing protein [Isoptericola sp. b515]MDO8151936.1 AzlD domain-containing protein [Isoptericola sp. b408]
MTPAALWLTVLVASVVSLGLKLAGHHVPQHWLATDRVQRTSVLVTVALLVALVVVQTFADGTALVVDARLPALAVAAVALALRAPFVLVIVLAAATAAGLRALGWG